MSARSGVSLSTVGMILNGHGARYAAETRRRVEEAAREVHYKPNVAARGLRLNRSFLLGVSIFDANDNLLPEFIRGVQEGLQESHYSSLMFTHSTRDQEMNFLHACKERLVDGMIINPAFYAAGKVDTGTSYRNLAKRDVPMVEVFGRVASGTPSVNIDNFHAGRTATEHLLSLGHRRIAMLTHSLPPKPGHAETKEHHPSQGRFHGYEAAMTAAGLQTIPITYPLVSSTDYASQHLAAGFAAFERVRQHEASPTAVVCDKDWEAIGLLQSAREHGADVPGQLSVTGFADQDVSHLVQPRLTTFKVPSFEVGKRAATSLLKLIEKELVEDELVPPEFLIRQSTGPAPKS